MKKILKNTIKNLIAVSIILPLSVSADCIITTENFSSQSKVIYVNEVNGSDSLAKAYEGGQVNNPYQPNNNVYAFQTIDKALSLKDEARGDIILLRRGSQWVKQDVWEGNTLNQFNQQAQKAQKYSRQQCEANNLTWVTPRTKPDTEQAPVTVTEVTVPEDIVAAAATIDSPKQNYSDTTNTDNQIQQQTNTTSRSSGGSSSGGSSSGGGDAGNLTTDNSENLSLGDNQTQSQFDGQKLTNSSIPSLTPKPVSSETKNSNDDGNVDVVENVPDTEDTDNNGDSEEPVDPNNQSEETLEPNEQEQVVTTPPIQNAQICEVNAGWENQIFQYPKDQNGWSIISPNSDTRIMYVSSSDGNDDLARPYLSAEHSDPFNPKNVMAYKSIGKALSQARDGKPDWVLLKRGDNFEIGGSLRFPSGRALGSHFVFGAYGSSKKRPFVDTKDNSAIALTRSLSFITVTGIEFYPSKMDPNSSTFLGWGNMNNSVHGFASISGEPQVQGLYLENNRFSFYNNNITLSGNSFQNNIVIRRNELLNAYSDHRHSQGIFAGNSNLLLIEENIFDHNGWYTKRTTDIAVNNKIYGTATVFNHNAYIADSSNLIIRNNLFSRSSSIGIKLTSNADTSTKINKIRAKNHLIKGNIIVEGEVGISAGGNKDFNNGYRWQNIHIVDNILTNIGRGQPTTRTLAFHIEVDDWDTGTVCGNYLQDQSNPNIKNINGIKLGGINNNVQVTSNSVVDLGLTEPSYKSSSFENVINNNNLYITKSQASNTLDAYVASKGFMDYETFIKTELMRISNDYSSYFDFKSISKSLMEQADALHINDK